MYDNFELLVAKLMNIRPSSIPMEVRMRIYRLEEHGEQAFIDAYNEWVMDGRNPKSYRWLEKIGQRPQPRPQPQPQQNPNVGPSYHQLIEAKTEKEFLQAWMDAYDWEMKRREEERQARARDIKNITSVEDARKFINRLIGRMSMEVDNETSGTQ